MTSQRDLVEDPVPAISGLLARLGAAWTAGDADAYADLFTPDAQYVAFDGTVMSGPAEIAWGHRPLFAGIMKGSRLVSEHTSIRVLDPNAAIVLSRGGIVMSWQRSRSRPSRSRRSTLTLVAVRHDGRWAWTAFQNTRYRPFAKTLLGRLVTRSQTPNLHSLARGKTRDPGDRP